MNDPRVPCLPGPRSCMPCPWPLARLHLQSLPLHLSDPAHSRASHSKLLAWHDGLTDLRDRAQAVLNSQPPPGAPEADLPGRCMGRCQHGPRVAGRLGPGWKGFRVDGDRGEGGGGDPACSLCAISHERPNGLCCGCVWVTDLLSGPGA